MPTTGPALFTPDDLLAAWDRVRENDGCAGADGVTISAFSGHLDQNLESLRIQTADDRYSPFPLLQIIVQKHQSKKSRTLLVPTVRDRVLQTAAARALSKSFEEEFLECSFAYRPGRGVDRAVARLRELHYQGYEYVVDADIHAFFDELDHDLLLARLEQQTGIAHAGLFRLIRQWVRGEWWDGQIVHPLTKGIPQGSPISPLLANYFLEDFDRELEASGRKLVRYSDDFVILAKSESQAKDALHRTAEVLKGLHLALALEKTQVVSFEQGFHFLGAFFHKDEIWAPWKSDRKTAHVVFMARPIPPRLRASYQSGARPAKGGPRTAAARSPIERSIHRYGFPLPHPTRLRAAQDRRPAAG
jgi:group II intron reverse transcriptase/maturase